jgi:hypothetical protein
MLVVLVAGCAGGKEQAIPPSAPPPDCDSPSYPGPWAACPEADWVRAVAYQAGYRVVGESGSAIELERPGHGLYVWTTPADGPGEPGHRRTLADTVVTANGVRAWWDISGLRVWVSGGPASDLPRSAELEELVAASVAVSAPG